MTSGAYSTSSARSSPVVLSPDATLVPLGLYEWPWHYPARSIAKYVSYHLSSRATELDLRPLIRRLPRRVSIELVYVAIGSPPAPVRCPSRTLEGELGDSVAGRLGPPPTSLSALARYPGSCGERYRASPSRPRPSRVQTARNQPQTATHRGTGQGPKRQQPSALPVIPARCRQVPGFPSHPGGQRFDSPRLEFGRLDRASRSCLGPHGGGHLYTDALVGTRSRGAVSSRRSCRVHGGADGGVWFLGKEGWFGLGGRGGLAGGAGWGRDVPLAGVAVGPCCS